jgi:hypothetical protein
MALEREKFLVYLQDENEAVTCHPVTVRHVDMARGESEHLRHGGTQQEGLGLATAHCWAAMVRLGLYTRDYPRFRDMDCAGLEDDGREVVDPTQPGTTGGSASS